MVKKIFRAKFTAPKWLQKAKGRIAQIKKIKVSNPTVWLDNIVTMTLKLGTLALVLFLIVFIARIFQKQGYAIEPFSVPESFEQNGYTGMVIANKIQDEVLVIKEIAQSVKKDSVKLIGNNDMEFNLAVMGVGVSISSVAFHIREMFGRKNQLIRGEITQVDNTYNLTLRMSGYPPRKHEVKILDGDKKSAISSLLRKAGEIVLGNQDLYRLAVYCYREKRYEEAIDLVRQIIRERPQEIHWAYLAWGSVLEGQNRHEEAMEKFRRAVEVNPNFDLAYTRLSWGLSRLGKQKEATAMMKKSVELNPNQPGRWINLGWLYYSQGNIAGADSAFRRATEIDPDDLMLWSNWANSKMQANNLEGIDPIVERLEALAGENAYGYMAKAVVSSVRKDTVQAYQHLETALDFDPQLPYAIEANIYTSWEKKDYSKVTRIYEKSNLSKLSKYSRQRMLNIIAMSYNYLERPDAAFEAIHKAIETDPNTAYPYSTLAEIYALTGDLENFYNYLEKSFQLGMTPASLDFDLEPYASLEKEARLINLLERYGKLKG